MKLKIVNGMLCDDRGIRPTKVTIRGEKTGDFITVSLADDKNHVFLQVPYSEIRKVVRSL